MPVGDLGHLTSNGAESGIINTMEELVESLKADGVLKTPEIISAFQACDRKDFVNRRFRDRAYDDAPLPIGSEQTISQPYTVAFMLELLRPQSGQKILDVGFGSGWTTALLAHIVGVTGKVYALEVIPEIFEFGQDNIEKYSAKSGSPSPRPELGTKAGGKNIELRLGSGRSGWPAYEPFDRILVSAAALEVPGRLKEQLTVGGRLVIPVGGDGFFGQSVKLVERIGEREFREEDHHGFAFVPLVK